MICPFVLIPKCGGKKPIQIRVKSMKSDECVSHDGPLDEHCRLSQTFPSDLIQSKSMKDKSNQHEAAPRTSGKLQTET
jgi:hypothetical protein